MKNIIVGTIYTMIVLGLMAMSFTMIRPIQAQEQSTSQQIPGQFSIITELPYHGIGESDSYYILKDVGHILVYGGMGLGEYRDMVKAFDLFESKKINHVVIHLNSGGGDVFAGMSMGQLMREKIAHGWTIEVQAQGLVASAAVRVLVSGSKGLRYVAPYSLVMVHELSQFTYMSTESTADKRRHAKILKMIQDNGTQYMSEMTGIPFDELVKMREDETWLVADKAVEKGFADALLDFAPGGDQ